MVGMNLRQPNPAEVAETIWDRVVSVDLLILGFLKRHSLTLLRVSLGVVFIWFGALKIFGVTPVADLVASVVYWVDPDWFVPALGIVEFIVGVGLLVGRGLRAILLVFVAQMIGAFLVLVIRPDIAFQNGNPLLLTTEGEFVVKNLVLISAGLTVGSHLRSLPRWTAADPASPQGQQPPVRSS